MSHEGYHEPFEKLPESVRDMHRAITSLMEELEAVDWYYQRAAVCGDEALKAVLLHNAHEEIEHAAMTLEWIRRKDEKFDANLREYLFRQGSIVGQEVQATGGGGAITTNTEVTAPRGPAAANDGGGGGGTRATLGSLRDEGRGRK